MKTPSTVKHTAALFSTVALLALPGHAAQNFIKTHSFTTGDSVFGASAFFKAYDSHVPPSGTKLGVYQLTATGNVVGKAIGKSFTALTGNGTVKVLSNGTGTFSGTLKVLGTSLLNVSNQNLATYRSTSFVRSARYDGSFGVPVGPLTVSVKAKVTASVDARFRVSTTFTPTETGIPQVAVTAGPVASIGATAEAGVGASLGGLASVSAGAGGSLQIGKAGLRASVTLTPSSRFILAANGPTLARTTASANVVLTVDKGSTNGRLFVWAEGSLLGATIRGSKTIGSYTGSNSSVNLLGPVNFPWY